MTSFRVTTILLVTIYVAILQTIESLNNASFRRKSSLQNSILFASKPVTITFEPSGKSIVAEQGALISDVAAKAGVFIPYKCKQGRCNSCEVRLNGRGKTINFMFFNRFYFTYRFELITVSAKACQKAQVPAGPTKTLSVVVVNKSPL